MGCSWKPVPLGPLRAVPLAVASSYGLPGREVERASERGVSLFLWGALRLPDFGRGLRAVAARRRDRVLIGLQSFAARPLALRLSLEASLRYLRVDHVDLLGLGHWQAPPPPALLDAARALREAGKARSLMISSHSRGALARLAHQGDFDVLMLRYNAAHRGAEREVFPAARGRVGTLAYSATRWATLLDPSLLAPGEPPVRATDCYRFVLTHPAIDACLCGPKDASELDGALRALDEGPMSPAEIAWISAVGDRARARALSPRPPLTLRALAGHAAGTARTLLRDGVTEELLSRFNR